MDTRQKISKTEDLINTINLHSPMQMLRAPWTAAECTAPQAPSGHSVDRAAPVLTGA